MTRPRPLSSVRIWSGVLALVISTTTLTGAGALATRPPQVSKGGFTIRQTATTVWRGVYTEEQAARGEATYRRRCAKCHRTNLRGDGALQGDGSEVVPSLLDLSFFLRWNERTIADMFLAISNAMPWDAPGTLRPQANIDVVSYVLKMNGIPSGETELPTETDKLAQILITLKPLGN